MMAEGVYGAQQDCKKATVTRWRSNFEKGQTFFPILSKLENQIWKKTRDNCIA